MGKTEGLTRSFTTGKGNYIPGERLEGMKKNPQEKASEKKKKTASFEAKKTCGEPKLGRDEKPPGRKR